MKKGKLFSIITLVVIIGELLLPLAAKPALAGLEAQKTIHLKKGWNLVGLPFNATTGDIEAGGCTIEEAPAWLWNGSAYEQTSNLEAYKGYWIKVANDCTVTLKGEIQQIGKTALHQGWNMVAGVANKTLKDLGLNCDILGTPKVYEWNGSQYIKKGPNDLLEEGKAYFVKCGITFDYCLDLTPDCLIKNIKKFILQNFNIDVDSLSDIEVSVDMNKLKCDVGQKLLTQIGSIAGNIGSGLALLASGNVLGGLWQIIQGLSDLWNALTSAFSPERWDMPDLGTFTLTKIGADAPYAVKARYSIKDPTAWWGPCDLPGITIRIPALGINYNERDLDFEMAGWRIKNGKIWVQLPMTCKVNFKAHTLLNPLAPPDMSHWWFLIQDPDILEGGKTGEAFFIYQIGGSRIARLTCHHSVAPLDTFVRVEKNVVLNYPNNDNYKVEGNNLARYMDAHGKNPNMIYEKVYEKTIPKSGNVYYMLYWKPEINMVKCSKPAKAGYFIKKQKLDGTIEVIDGASTEGIGSSDALTPATLRANAQAYQQALEKVPAQKYGKAYFEEGEKVIIDLWGCRDSGFRIGYWKS